MKVWISKYALTRGIYAVESATIPREGDIKFTATVAVDGPPHLIPIGRTYKQNEWHLTKKEAIKRADIMRENKIRALEKQIYKLKHMDFTR
jgi:hypothetical protein